ncbi:NlpC/P60 family protein [Streptomyces sp. BV129]|uniref:C40 family peptidase n=1 Tax=Streptomyces sp. BV129 TaxID=2849671 RepID=UPI001C2EBC3B|nr:C40 family peptidase [Streptomyces sp. BV129]MBV1950282.1 C40 family peptidase [Streptomyces sp. BV129]
MASHRRAATPGCDRGAAALCVLSAAAAALGAVPAAHAAPRDGARAELDRLYAQAERATEDYDRADERADKLRHEVHDAQDHIARTQQRVNSLRDQLGSLAGAEYRSGGLDPAVALLFSADPDDYLDKASVVDRIGARQAGQLRELRGALRDLAQERAEAVATLGDLERSREAVAAHKRSVREKLARARRLFDALPGSDRAEYTRGSRSGRPDLTGPGALGSRAAAALAAARSALGRPYVWGANGPSGFDCSGLMQWSYARAGVQLPRTSQAQRDAGHRVPLSQARPGDLVIYRSDASHVAMYVGNGQVIHAPHPGAPVRYDSVGMLPVSAVTRP